MFLMCVYVCMLVCVYVCMCILHVYSIQHKSMCTAGSRVRSCVYVYMCIYLYSCLGMCIYSDIYFFLYMCVYVYMCVRGYQYTVIHSQ